MRVLDNALGVGLSGLIGAFIQLQAIRADANPEIRLNGDGEKEGDEPADQRITGVGIQIAVSPEVGGYALLGNLAVVLRLIDNGRDTDLHDNDKKDLSHEVKDNTAEVEPDEEGDAMRNLIIDAICSQQGNGGDSQVGDTKEFPEDAKGCASV